MLDGLMIGFRYFHKKIFSPACGQLSVYCPQAGEPSLKRKPVISWDTF